MSSLSFPKIETKNLNSHPGILISSHWELRHQLHSAYLSIRSGHEKEAAIYELSKAPLKTFVKLAEDFNIFI